MLKQSLKFGAVLIGGYLILNNYTGAKTVLDSGSKGGIGLVKAFQGRN